MKFFPGVRFAPVYPADAAAGGHRAPQPGRRGGHRWGQVPCTRLYWGLYSTDLYSLGCQTLYHLAKMGVTNTVLLEKDQLTAGRYSNVLSQNISFSNYNSSFTASLLCFCFDPSWISSAFGAFSALHCPILSILVESWK